MAVNDVTLFDDGIAVPGSKRYAVHAGRASAIVAGDLVLQSLGTKYVTAWTAGGGASAVKPSVGTDFVVGLATSKSTETTSADGVVDVMPIVPGMTFLVAPNSAASWDTQAEYDALVGDRVLLNYSATGVFTILATDYGGNATNGLGSGCVVEPLDIAKHPNKVRFSLKQRLSPTT
jgi:hypothetical protein